VLANAETKWAVLKAVDALLGHFANGRHAESVAAFTDDADVTLIGSEAGEVVVGPQALRQFFADLYAEPHRILFTLPERTISASGNVAWFTGEGTFRLSTEDGEGKPYRLTGVLERRGERWLWQLFCGSEPSKTAQP
jgi:ketosteroid isomerase-like protein